MLANSCDICYNNYGCTAQYTQIVQYCFTLFLEEREIMAKTEAVYARIDTNLKHKAEGVLSKLGISPSSAIQMLYSQIVLQQGMPFESKLPKRKPVALASLSQDELDAERH